MDQLPLTDILVELRRQLDEARKKAEDERVQFAVESIDLELQVTATLGAEAGGGFKFWVISGDARTKVAAESIQKVHMRLNPKVLDDTGAPGPLNIDDERDLGAASQ